MIRYFLFQQSVIFTFSSDLFPALDDTPSERINLLPLCAGVCHHKKTAFKTENVNAENKSGHFMVPSCMGKMCSPMILELLL